jgi:hypothetical protein
MLADGKHLEGIVAFVQETLLPQGFDVKTNERVYNDNGVQIAEFDIQIRGKVGPTAIAWLIECRDRPGDGPAPGSWIEQLVGRRIRFGFNKVTAVSTTGFAMGAIEFARAQGIELREVKALNAEEFRDWLAITKHHHIERITALHHASIFPQEMESAERKRALLGAISSVPANVVFLKSSKSSELVTLANAFSRIVSEAGTLFDGLIPNGPGKKVRLHVQYSNDEDHFVIETGSGPIRVQAILFQGDLHIKETVVPLSITAEYRHAETGETISQLAAFAPQEIHGMKFSMEMHRIADCGETHIIMRRVRDNG